MAFAGSGAHVDAGVVPPRYRDLVRLAGGAMGEVYRALDGELQRPVAIKLLPERYAAEHELRQRFTREALAAARLSAGPNTVTVYDVGEWQGCPYIVMEYLAGGSAGASAGWPKRPQHSITPT
jgi:serine/threonine protein kinase